MEVLALIMFSMIGIPWVLLPSSDIQFLKELANRMGWKANTVNSETSKTELDKAILDVKKGNVKNFDTLEEMMNYLDA